MSFNSIEQRKPAKTHNWEDGPRIKLGLLLMINRLSKYKSMSSALERSTIKRDRLFTSWMECAFVMCYSDILLILKAGMFFSFGGQTVMSARYLTLFAKGHFSRLPSEGPEPYPPGWRIISLITGSPWHRNEVWFTRGITLLSVHNSNKNPGQSRMIAIISVVRLFEEERELFRFVI